MGIADGDVAKMKAEIEANLKREVKRRIEAKTKDQVMEALLTANPITVPTSLVDMEIQRLMQSGPPGHGTTRHEEQGFPDPAGMVC